MSNKIFFSLSYSYLSYLYPNDYLDYLVLQLTSKIIKQYNYNVLEQKFIHDDMKFNHQISYTIYNKYLISIKSGNSKYLQ